MDGVLCDFKSAAINALEKTPEQRYPQARWGFFLGLKPIPGAIDAFRKLSEKYDVWILTRPSPQNVNCYTEKAQWVWNNLGEEVVEKVIMSCDKNLLKGDFLIDDNQWDFEGRLIKFGSTEFPDWNSVLKFFEC